VRKEGFSSGQLLRVIPKDTVVLISGDKQDWYHLTDEDNADKGWLSKSLAVEIGEAKAADTAKAADSLAAAKAVVSAVQKVDTAKKEAAAPPKAPETPAIESEPLGKKTCRTFDDVNAALSASVGTVMDFYSSLQKTEKTLKGKVVVNFLVMNDGTISAPSITVSSVKNKPLEEKVISTISACKFPALATCAKPISVSYPLYFMPQ
jgi:TonB family protein